MTEHPRPYKGMTGTLYRWWFRELGIGGPWTSQFSFNEGRTWHRYVWEAFDTAMRANELQIMCPTCNKPLAGGGPCGWGCPTCDSDYV